MRNAKHSILAMLLCSAGALAQQPEKAAEAPPAMSPEMQAMMQAWEKASTPGAQHAQLAQHFVGNWDAEQTMWMDPAAEPTKQSSKATTESLFGGRTLRMDYQGDFMGQPFQGISYIGYDNVTGKYYSTWTDSMATGFMLAYGDYDAATKTYVFRAEMADPMKAGSMVPIRNVIRIVDADHHAFEMHETHDGKERKSMVIEYTRAK